MSNGDANKDVTIITDKKNWSLTDRFIANPVGAGIISVFGTVAVLGAACVSEDHKERLQRMFGLD